MVAKSSSLQSAELEIIEFSLPLSDLNYALSHWQNLACKPTFQCALWYVISVYALSFDEVGYSWHPVLPVGTWMVLVLVLCIFTILCAYLVLHNNASDTYIHTVIPTCMCDACKLHSAFMTYVHLTTLDISVLNLYLDVLSIALLSRLTHCCAFLSCWFIFIAFLVCPNMSWVESIWLVILVLPVVPSISIHISQASAFCQCFAVLEAIRNGSMDSEMDYCVSIVRVMRCWCICFS